jgi:hypothetical protein
MRKVIIVSIMTLFAAGCQDTFESLRRVEVWKQQTFFAPSEAPAVAPAPGCNCGAATQMEMSQATTVSLGVVPGPESTVSTSMEESDGVLKQP